jgi:hypothetical protein
VSEGTYNNEPSERSRSKDNLQGFNNKDPPFNTFNTTSSHDCDNNGHSKQPTSQKEQHFNKSPLFNINTGSLWRRLIPKLIVVSSLNKIRSSVKALACQGTNIHTDIHTNE